jgi:hypothetical protein
MTNGPESGERRLASVWTPLPGPRPPPGAVVEAVVIETSPLVGVVLSFVDVVLSLVAESVEHPTSAEIATSISTRAASREWSTLNCGRKTGAPLSFAGDPVDPGRVCITECAFS